MKIVATGAFGFTGREIARQALERGWEVATLTNKTPKVDPFDGRVAASPLSFSDPNSLKKALEGADVLVNTYWVRFNRANFQPETAVANSETLFQAARAAGIRRIVHTSVANPSEDSPFEYYRGKARVENALKTSGVPFSILRPAVIFGPNDILLNNIAWTLRRFPIVGYVGDGRYRIRPIFIEDFARLALDAATRSENETLDAVGPEDFPYVDLLRTVGTKIRRRRPLIRVPFGVAFAVAWSIGKWRRDVFLTRPELRALVANLLTSDAPATGTTKLSDWVEKNAETIGRVYASELARRR